MELSVEFWIALVTLLCSGAVQKVTGMGFALVATPVMVLLYGPQHGVLIVIVMGLLISLVMLATSVRHVLWRPVLMLCVGGAIATPIGVIIAAVTSDTTMMITVGVAAVCALLAPYALRHVRRTPNASAAVAAGFASGFLHVTSGLSGPPLVGYATLLRWDHIRFVASVQMVFIVFHIFTLGTRGLPNVPLVPLALMGASVFIGFGLGILLDRVIPTSWARRGMFTVAWAGALTVIARGIVAL